MANINDLVGESLVEKTAYDIFDIPGSVIASKPAGVVGKFVGGGAATLGYNKRRVKQIRENIGEPVVTGAGVLGGGLTGAGLGIYASRQLAPYVSSGHPYVSAAAKIGLPILGALAGSAAGAKALLKLHRKQTKKMIAAAPDEPFGKKAEKTAADIFDVIGTGKDIERDVKRGAKRFMGVNPKRIGQVGGAAAGIGAGGLATGAVSALAAHKLLNRYSVPLHPLVHGAAVGLSGLVGAIPGAAIGGAYGAKAGKRMGEAYDEE